MNKKSTHPIALINA